MEIDEQRVLDIERKIKDYQSRITELEDYRAFHTGISTGRTELQTPHPDLAGSMSILVNWNTITPFHWNSIGTLIASMGAAEPASRTFEGINYSYHYPFLISKQCTAYSMFYSIDGVASGNIDLGIYNENHSLVASTGSQTHAGNGITTTSLPSPTTLVPGYYYLAVAMDNTTGTLLASLLAGAIGRVLQLTDMRRSVSNFPLASNPTFDTTTNITTPAYLIGISLRSVFP